MTDNSDHPINRAINDTILEIVKALQVSLKHPELSSDEKVRAATISLAEAINHYRTFLCQIGLEISYTMLLQHFQNLRMELAAGEANQTKKLKDLPEDSFT